MTDANLASERAGPTNLGPLDPKNPTPLYYQIYHLYRQRILTGQLQKGDKLPSESALEAALGVSRITAKRAMDELAKDDLVTRERGRGTTVKYSVPTSSMEADFSGLMENLIAIGDSTTVEVLSFTYVPAPGPIARALGLDPDAEVQKAERLRKKDNQPFSYIVTHVPEEIGRSFGPEDLSNRPILSLIEATTPGISEAEQSVTALAAPPAIAVVLGIPENAAVLRVVRVVRDRLGRPVQHIEVYYRPDLYQLNMRLSRVETGPGTRIWAASTTGTME
ncbi:GntR family transcriptional regulator [Thalassococcus sp. S3]|uniref:GntR family transcriptional regulator n=1 Tax=Thalassococcus sp. S3 TaxID=2017482 RepID=UPI0013EE499D|nr:GntR family transcriptional regulator [Thalassococcus sp. S3]